MPKEKTTPEEPTKKPNTLSENELDDNTEGFSDDFNIPTSLNEELKDKLDDNPNHLIGCGG